nr:MAG TPA: Biopolymer transport protein [Caudoviricetes sp.]
MTFSLPASSWISLFIIVAVFLLCLYWVRRYKQNDKLTSNRRLIEFFPTAVSTLGVLGTFYGITEGLLAFDTSNLDESIPKLLDGLKTAFITSLTGMIGSMVLSTIINRKQDENDGGVSDINQAAGTICTAVKQMSDLNRETITKLANQMAESEKDRKAFYRTMSDVMDRVKQSQSNIATTLDKMNASETTIASTMDSLVILQRSQESALANISETSAASLKSIGNLEETTAKQTAAIAATEKHSEKISDSTRNLPEILDVLSGMSGTQDEMNDQVQKLKDILDAEVLSIEESMDKTNKLLERKFDEFTELLKKSNTEALVEVMKKVTEEFQKQMNALINKLIQENFDQLNKSVERLNQWQQENKEMIASLTRQYKEMATNFEATSTSLDKVKNDTAMLVSEGGKLRQLVDALNEVIINDQKFLEISNKLQQTADLSHSNMESFDASTKALNDWVRKQRNFVDAVQLLLEKLDEISKIKDYNEQFWQGTKRSLEEGLGIIKSGSQTLNTQLTNLDRQFYARLGTTLAELDSCIQAMVKGK